MPVNHTKEFLKSIHTKAFFPELFSQNFEQLFQIGETFFQQDFWLKLLHMVRTLTGQMSSENLKSTLLYIHTACCSIDAYFFLNLLLLTFQTNTFLKLTSDGASCSHSSTNSRFHHDLQIFQMQISTRHRPNSTEKHLGREKVNIEELTLSARLDFIAMPDISRFLVLVLNLVSFFNLFKVI